MSGQAYQGMTQRTFRQALFHLLETDYGILGSQRVLELLAKDIEQLIENFYPPPERLAPGWMILTGTKASGAKVRPGQRAGEHELVTLAWPVLLAEDIQQLAQQGVSRFTRNAWQQKRLVRLIEYGQAHPKGPVLLTQGDLSALLGLNATQVCYLLQAARQQTGKALPTLGYYFDQGRRPTHKAEIIALYEAGVDEAEITRRSGHSADGVGNYIRGYERVILMLKRGTPLEEIGFLLGMQPSLVKEYAKIIAKHHPELLPNENPPS
jgi:hypothetical protein